MAISGRDRLAWSPRRRIIRKMTQRGRLQQLPQLTLRVLSGQQRDRVFTRTADLTRLGTAPQADIVLNEDTVSRLHCEILRGGTGYRVRDLGSTNGTFVDGAEVREAYLRPGSLLTLGAVELEFGTRCSPLESTDIEEAPLPPLVGESLPIRRLRATVRQVAAADISCTVFGEPGSGVRTVASWIHRLSSRAQRPRICFDCTLADDKQQRQVLLRAGGALDRAEGGILQLEQVAQLSPVLQEELLTSLEQPAAAGSRDVRIISTARSSLTQEVQCGRFHKRLSLRLQPFSVPVPALRERQEDLPELITELCARGGQAPPSLNTAAVEQLSRLRWPGNVPQLAESLVVAQLLSDGGRLAAKDRDSFDPALSYRQSKQRWNTEFEGRYLRWLLTQTAGNVSGAARQADMDRKYLHKLLTKHGLRS